MRSSDAVKLLTRRVGPFSLLCSLAMVLFGFGPCSKSSTSSSRTTAPSTGSEAGGSPQTALTPAQAAAAVSAAMVEYKKGPTADCQKVIKGLVSGLPDDVTAANEASFYALADCAQREKRWSLMKQATVRLIRGDKNFPHPAMLPTAEIGMGEYTKAQTDVAALLPRYPKDPEILMVKGIIPCKQMQWAACLQGMDDAVKLAHAVSFPTVQTFEGNADVHRADAFMHLGQLDQAQKAIDAADKLGGGKAAVAGIRKDLVPAKASKVVIDEFHQSELPLGIYHLYGKTKEAGVPAQVWVYNIGTADRQFKVESEIVGVTDVFTSNVTVLKGANEVVPMVPTLKASFQPNAQRSDMPALMHVKVTALDPKGPTVVFDESDQIKLLPHDSLMLAVRVDEDATRPFDDYMGAWVTPNAKAVDAFLQAAKKRAPKETFAGTQSATLPQVEAIYEELHERGVSYVMDPEVASDTGFAQRTRLPSDVLTSNNAQCLEGAILFATMMEAIGLDPMIIRIPGHAFVGWHSAKDPVPDGTRLYVETTMVHTASFADAVKYAKVEFDKQTGMHHFEQGISRIIEIKTLRGKGITPQPWE